VGKSLAVDVIGEKGAGTGVTVDSVELKDGLVDAVDVAAFKTTYDAHDHSAADPQTVDFDNLGNKPTGVTGGATHGATAHENEQETIWVPVVASTDGTDTDLFGGIVPNHRLADNANKSAGVSWHAPSDLVSLDSIQDVWLFGATANIYYRVRITTIADGEFYNADAANTAYGTLAGTLNKRKDGAALGSGDLAPIGNVVAGDIVGLVAQRDAAHASDTLNAAQYFLGFIIKYTRSGRS
ncbi:hypothetical protein LCGC14_2940280, partial [marine sediment metagenome]